jgi:2-amino-4-hydroxy-6-hydroxymethyldihydropteridine diphosphokinase
VIIVGLGANIGTDDEIVQRFVRAGGLLGAARWARLYRTAPIGPAQAPFLNTAISIDDREDILDAIMSVEQQLGRVRDVRWGPRTIDLDVLVWDDRIIDTPRLVVPHPRLHQRRFALAPLVDLVGDDFVIPHVGRAGDALARVHDQLADELGEVRAMRVDE